MSTNLKNIVVYDRTNGHAYLTDLSASNPSKGGMLLVTLGTQPTLPHAVGEARRLGHRVDGWMPVGTNAILGVEAICTPFDHLAD